MTQRSASAPPLAHPHIMFDWQAVAKHRAEARASVLDSVGHTTDPSTPNPSRSSRPPPAPVRHIKHTRIARTRSKPYTLLPRAGHPDIPLSANTMAGLTQSLEHGLSRGTQSNYKSAVSQFLTFCDRENIDPALQFPANEFILCAFVGSLANQKSGQTASNLMAGLKAWHRLHGKTWHGGYLLAHVLRGTAVLTPASSKRPPRPPVTIAMLIILASVLDRSDPKDAAILAAALIAFWGQCRLGELLGTSRLRHNPLIHPSRSAITQSRVDSPSLEIHLPRTKTNQITGQTVFLTDQRDPISPIKALRAHLHLNSSIQPDHHLFAYRSRGQIKCLTKEDFLTRCNEIWSSHNFDRVTGHAFRIGGTHAFLTAGVPDDVVKKLGRWASDAFLRYWRGLNHLAHAHTNNLHTRGHPDHSGSRPSGARKRPPSRGADS